MRVGVLVGNQVLREVDREVDRLSHPLLSNTVEMFVGADVDMAARDGQSAIAGFWRCAGLPTSAVNILVLPKSLLVGILRTSDKGADSADGLSKELGHGSSFQSNAGTDAVG